MKNKIENGRKKEERTSLQFHLSDQIAAFSMSCSTLSDTFMLPSQQR